MSSVNPKMVDLPLLQSPDLTVVLTHGPSLDGPTVMAWVEAGKKGRASVMAQAEADACKVEVDEFDSTIAAVHVGGTVFWIQAEHAQAARQVIPC